MDRPETLSGRHLQHRANLSRRLGLTQQGLADEALAISLPY